MRSPSSRTVSGISRVSGVACVLAALACGSRAEPEPVASTPSGDAPGQPGGTGAHGGKSGVGGSTTQTQPGGNAGAGPIAGSAGKGTSGGGAGPSDPCVGAVIDDADPCTIDQCDPEAGITHTSVAGCSLCVSDAACDDGNPCTDDVCDPQTHCVHSARPDGTAVSDGNACNGLEVCVGGVAQPGSPVDVEDGDGCTLDGCDPQTGAVTHEKLAHCTPESATACAGAELPTACPAGKVCGKLAGRLFDSSRGCVRWSWLTCANVCGSGELTSCFTVKRADGTTDQLRFPNHCIGSPELETIGVTLGCQKIEDGPWPECP